MALKFDMWHRVQQYYQDCSNNDHGLFSGKIKHVKTLKHKIIRKHMKISDPKCSFDDIGLALTILWQNQICFSGFHMVRVY